MLLHFVKADHIPDKLYLKYQYHYVFGKRLNLKNPQTFNEKLQWLKLYDRNPLYTTLVDKYAVKKWVASLIGEQYIIPTLAVYNKAEDLDLSLLPNQFVLKCNHDSGSILICKDKNTFDLNKAQKHLDLSLKQNFYYKHREWPYKNVKRRIIVEQFLDDCIIKEDGNSIMYDYRFYCFNGKPCFVYVYTNILSSDNTKPNIQYCNYYDINWQPLPFHQHSKPTEHLMKKPKQFNEMLVLSKSISESIPFVRVDFYCNKRVYFGEITFFPGSGLSGFYPEQFDSVLGSYLVLPTKRK